MDWATCRPASQGDNPAQIVMSGDDDVVEPNVMCCDLVVPGALVMMAMWWYRGD